MKLNQLKSNPNNPRLIKDDKFKKLVTSLREFPEMMEKRYKKASTDASIKAALFLPLKLLLHSF